MPQFGHKFHYAHHRPGKAVRGVIAAAAIGTTGLFLLQAISAATESIATEAETGTVAGAARTADINGASGGSAVTFGAVSSEPLAAPKNVRVFAGGNSIAVRWDPSLPNNTGIREYEVYRNNVKVGTSTPGPKAEFPERLGNGYIDKTATVSQANTYHIVAVASDGRRTQIASEASATSRAAGVTTATNVTVDPNAPADLKPYLTNTVKPFLETWYPKATEMFTRPAPSAGSSAPLYAPWNGFTITAATTNSGGVTINGTTLTVDAAFARSKPDDTSAWLLMATNNIASGLVEGDVDASWIRTSLMAQVTGNLLNHRAPAAPTATQTHLNGWYTGAYFLDWANSQTTHKDLIYRLNASLRTPEVTAEAMLKHTGKTVTQLWTQMTGRQVTTSGDFAVSNLDYCVDAAGSGTANGTKVQAWNCNYTNAQSLTRYSLGTSGQFLLSVLGSCLDVVNSGTTDGTKVHLWNCNGTSAQTWHTGNNLSVVNTATGKCLQVTGGATFTVGAQLEISTCTGANHQQWSHYTIQTAPTGLKAWTGGDSIALNWHIQASNPTLQRYEVYRGGIVIGTTRPDPDVAGEQFGTQFVDRNVSPGQSYTYSIRSIDANGNRSGTSATVTATHPTSPMPVPNVIIDASVNQHSPDMVPWLNQKAIPSLKTWYPKVAEVLAKGNFTPFSTLRIKSKDKATFEREDPGAGAYYDNSNNAGDFVMHPTFFKDNSDYYVSTLLHEAIHAMQRHYAGTIPYWYTEGVADYGRYLIMNGLPQTDNVPIRVNPATQHYAIDRYRPAAFLLKHIDDKVDPGYTRRFLDAAYDQNVSAAFLQFSNGRDINQVWGEATGKAMRIGAARNTNANKCVDIKNSSMEGGAYSQIWTCNGTIAQKMNVHQNNDGTVSLMLMSGCLEPANGDTRNGMVVWTVWCTGGNMAQRWTVRADGSLQSKVGTNKCLDVSNSGTADGTGIQIWDCNGSKAQKFTLP